MNLKSTVLIALVLSVIATASQAQTGAAVRRPPTQRQQPMGELDGAQFHTRFVRLGAQGEGLLYDPVVSTQGKGHIALIFTHPSANVLTDSPATQFSRRGYRMLMVNYRGGFPNDEAHLPTLSRGIAYLRSLPGVSKVVIVGHSGGGHLIPLYQNVAEHGSAACKGAEKIYPCQGTELDGLEKADGMVLLDPTLGAFHQMSSVDPAVEATSASRLSTCSALLTVMTLRASRRSTHLISANASMQPSRRATRRSSTMRSQS